MNTLPPPNITQSLSHRDYQDGDLAGVFELWDKNSGWGGITPQQFHDWHMDTPYGPCMIIVAEDNKGGIIGQIVFMPSKVYIDGRVKDYYRDMAPIIKNDLRGFNIKDFDHPTYAMLRFGIEQGKINGSKIIYSLPSIGWATTAKTFPQV